jgi:integral membrane protein (TIGR00529 family)
MPELSVSTLAFGKLLLTFGGILIFLRLRLALWKTLFIGCALLAILWSLPLAELAAIPLACLGQANFLCMQVMLFGIMVLSALQEAGGQSRRFVEGLEPYIRQPRIRLILFPAIVGLMPMPGGALFSCPMLEATARDLPIPDERKTLINYWFRHIWEMSWPLYPGYMLTCSLLGISLLTLVQYTFPLTFITLAAGWFFFLRDIPAPSSGATGQFSGKPRNKNALPLGRVLLEGLPLAVAVAGAGIFALLLGLAAPDAPSQLAFILSLCLAGIVAFRQNRKYLRIPLRRLFFNAPLFRLLLLIYAVFVFKDTIIASGLIGEISTLKGDTPVILMLFVLLPFLGGILTGVMVGFVGTCFPILLGLMAQAGLQEYTLPLVVAAVICGNAGQLLTPLHVCLIVSCEYFKTAFSQVWKRLLGPVAVQITCGVIWALCLALAGAGL